MKFVLAPRQAHTSLLIQIRKNDPFLDLRLLSKEDLRRAVYPSIKEEALVYLMEKYGLSYEISKMYLLSIPYVTTCIDNNIKMKKLLDIKEELIQNNLVVEPNDSTYLKNQNFDVYLYQEEDQELAYYFSKLNIKATFIKNEEKKIEAPFYTFPRIEEETYYVLNEIASLIANGKNINDILILKRDPEYDYYLKKFSESFNYKLNIKSSDNYLSSGIYKEFINLFIENKDIDLSLQQVKELVQDYPYLDDFIDYVKELKLDNVSFNVQLDYINNKLKEKKLPSIYYDKAVKVINDADYIQNKDIFVLGFAQGLFPKSVKEVGYFNNLELNQLHRNDVKEQTKIDMDGLLNFFYSNNHFHFSYSLKSLSGSYFASPIAEKLKLKAKSHPISDVFYSEKVLKYIYTNLKDLEVFYKERSDDFYKVRDVMELDYNTYDNSYKDKVNAFTQDSFVELSTTKLDLFNNCPFHYYLERVVKLKKEETIYALELGNLAHAVFEHHKDPGFDFDTFYDEEVAKHEFTVDQSFLVKTKLKDLIKEAFKAINLREQYYVNPTIENEKELKYYLDKKTLVVGKIDNLVTLDNQYFICIDYKTGSVNGTKFSLDRLKNGVSTQLPTYALLVSNQKEYEDLKIAGIYLNHVIADSLTLEKDDDDLIYDHLKLHGKTIADEKVVSKIDSTFVSNSSFIASIRMKKGGGAFISSPSLATEGEFEQYKNIVKEKYLEAANGIRNNDFKIEPLEFSNSESACRNCPFKDICYVNEKQVKPAVKEVVENEPRE